MLPIQNNFTVVTPNYNMGSYLAETIESVLTNLRPGDEYFIVDGGSTDDSVDIIRHYQHRITGWVSEKDRSYADALAKGFERANGEYQCWVNCGDLLLRGALDEARARLVESGAEMIFGDDVYVDDSGTVLQVTNGHVHNFASMMLYGGWTPLQDACYWRRSLYERVGGIDSTLRYAADYDLFLRMSLNGYCQYAPAVFSAFRRHEGQASNAHANEYQHERMHCRQRELSSLSVSYLHLSILKIFYWLKGRVRARVHSRNTKLPLLIGKNVADLTCQPSKVGTGL